MFPQQNVAHLGATSSSGKRHWQTRPSTWRQTSSPSSTCSSIQFWSSCVHCRCFWRWTGGVNMDALTGLWLHSPSDTFLLEPEWTSSVENVCKPSLPVCIIKRVQFLGCPSSQRPAVLEMLWSLTKVLGSGPFFLIPTCKVRGQIFIFQPWLQYRLRWSGQIRVRVSFRCRPDICRLFHDWGGLDSLTFTAPFTWSHIFIVRCWIFLSFSAILNWICWCFGS